ncbi:hypothetical protein HF521_015740 [Silurus meridionalis]|uniref:C-type lectin domain-containing protein n=1 Tax=Silurus meridionalis TaxID=175797 RepID=A0A8T0A4G4_SILME|nr:hypothetical protein HF521_015740 [Silurus meridionalis]
MQTIYKEISFDKTDRKKKSPSPTEEDVYVNTKDWQPKTKKCTELKNKKTGKIFISVLGLLLMLVALSTMCAIGIFYRNKVVSYELLNKKYADITETLMLMKHKVSETERQNEELKVKFQQVQEDLSACSETEKLYEILQKKYQRCHEHLSACKETQNCKLCEEGWKSLGLKCYYFSPNKLNWTQSRDDCVEKGGHLVIITSRAEQDFLSSQIRETHWIGLHDLETEGEWMWVNNQSLNETGIMFWFSAPEGPNEPDNWKIVDSSGENCGALGNESGATSKWFDASCLKLKKFICEK